MAWTEHVNEFQVGDTVYRSVNLIADASALTDHKLFDASTYTKVDGLATVKTMVKWMRVIVSSGISVFVEMDATTDILLMGCPENSDKIFPPEGFRHEAMSEAGELSTTDDSGVTGDIVATTSTGAVPEGFSVEMVIQLR